MPRIIIKNLITVSIGCLGIWAVAQWLGFPKWLEHGTAIVWGIATARIQPIIKR